MYRFMAEMSPRRQKMLFAAGVYVLWSLAYGLAAAVFPLPDEDISFFLSLGFIVAAAFNKAPKAEARMIETYPNAAAYIFAFGSAFFWSILLMMPVFLDFIMVYSGGEGFLPAFYVSCVGWVNLLLLIGFPVRAFLLIRREKRAADKNGDEREN